jgi:hypothetical protein
MREVHPIEDEIKVEDYVERTLQLKPYFSFKSIDDYKKDIELVEYLRVASVKDEEEIYESLSYDSHVWNIRPPFYKVLRAEDEIFKEFFNQYDLNDWAISVINSPRDMSQVIYRILDDKKKYIFRNLLKSLDEQAIGFFTFVVIKNSKTFFIITCSTITANNIPIETCKKTLVTVHIIVFRNTS